MSMPYIKSIGLLDLWPGIENPFSSGVSS